MRIGNYTLVLEILMKNHTCVWRNIYNILSSRHHLFWSNHILIIAVASGQFREGLGMQASKITKWSCTDYYS
jgi:hypothetical protein